MSAFVGLIHEGRAYLWADGAVADQDGTLVAVRRKAHALPGQRLALTSRGPEGVAALAVEVLATAGATADRFALDGAALMSEVSATIAPHLAEHWARSYDIAVAGWSEAAGGPFLFYWKHVEGEEPTLQRETDGMSAPPMERCDVPLFCAIGVTSPLQPERYGQHYMATLRNRPMLLPHETEPPGLYRIGGHVLQTSVGREGVSQTVLVEWDDKVGAPIDPFGASDKSHMAFGGPAHRERMKDKPSPSPPFWPNKDA